MDRKIEIADAQKQKEAERIAYEKTLVNPFTGIVEHPDGRKTHLDTGLPFEEDDIALKTNNMI